MEDREDTPVRKRGESSPRHSLTELLLEIKSCLLIQGQKLEELCLEKTISPRSRLESRTDAVVQNTQLLIKKVDENEKKTLVTSKEVTEISKQMSNIQATVRKIDLLEREVARLQMEIENMRRDFLNLEEKSGYSST